MRALLECASRANIPISGGEIVIDHELFHSPKRRVIVRALTVLLLLLGSVQADGVSLYAFMPTTVRAKVIQTYLDEACPKIDITVFGRQRDFNNQVLAKPPQVILASPIVIDSFKDYSSLLSARFQEKPNQPYFLVSIKAIDPENIEGLTLGVVDLLGAKGMQTYISGLLEKEVRLKRVTKLEDLLPLISFAAADTIFVSANTLKFIQSKTAIDLKVMALDIRLGIASVAIAADQRSVELEDAVRACVSSFGDQLNDVFGVDGWE